MTIKPEWCSLPSLTLGWGLCQLRPLIWHSILLLLLSTVLKGLPEPPQARLEKMALSKQALVPEHLNEAFIEYCLLILLFFYKVIFLIQDIAGYLISNLLEAISKLFLFKIRYDLNKKVQMLFFYFYFKFQIFLADWP